MTVALGVCKPAGRALEKADHGASNSLPSVHSIGRQKRPACFPVVSIFKKGAFKCLELGKTVLLFFNLVFERHVLTLSLEYRFLI